MRVLGIIPARYASTRFPGKPLVDINGKSMIQHVYDNAVSSGLFSKVVVATDDERIQKAVLDFEGEVSMTSDQHESGTDRCGEVLNSMNEQFDVVVNIQGDEPFLKKEQLQQLLSIFDNPKAQIATLKKRITDTEGIFNPSVVKAVSDIHGKAIYFSRNPIPFVRGSENDEWINKSKHYVHIGLYGFRAKVLKELVKLTPSFLEKSESLEQLRWLENGYAIYVAETEYNSIGIDTPEDLENLEL